MDFPDSHADRHPDKVAYQLGDRVVTYRELVDDSIRIANLLRTRSLTEGDVVALLLPNVPGLFEIAWACQRSGLRYTAINSHLTAPEIAYILGDSGAKALFTALPLAAAAIAAVAELDNEIQLFCIDGPIAGGEELAPLMAKQPLSPTAPECEGTDLLYSSGTTGRPKGVAAPLALPPLGTNTGTGRFLTASWSIDEHTVYLSPAPLYHSAPLRTCMTVQRFGGTVVVMDRFDAETALRLIERHHITHTQMVPTMMIRMLQLPEETRAKYDLSSLQALIHSAAPCPPAVKQSMIEWIGPIVDEFYASTEAPLVTMIRAQEALERPGSVGRPVVGIPHILSPEGEELPPGVPGVIWSEGGMEFEYLNAPEKTAATRNERGWRTVGDIGYLDEDGYLFLSDRREDMLVVGGVNVYPQETENVLVTHPDVLDVAVFGVPHEEYGHEVTAVVQLQPGVVGSPELADDLRRFCAEQLARVKCPRTISFTDQLPRTPTGKLLRRVLREQHTALAN